MDTGYRFVVKLLLLCHFRQIVHILTLLFLTIAPRTFII